MSPPLLSIALLLAAPSALWAGGVRFSNLTPTQLNSLAVVLTQTGVGLSEVQGIPALPAQVALIQTQSENDAAALTAQSAVAFLSTHGDQARAHAVLLADEVQNEWQSREEGGNSVVGTAGTRQLRLLPAKGEDKCLLAREYRIRADPPAGKLVVHPLRSAEEAAVRIPDETTWWVNRDYAAARGPVQTVGSAIRSLPAQDVPKLAARFRTMLGEEGRLKNVLRFISEGSARQTDPNLKLDYNFYIRQVADFNTALQKAESLLTGGPLADLFFVNKVARDRLGERLPESERFVAPAGAASVVYNLFFDYAGKLRPIEKVKSLMEDFIGQQPRTEAPSL